MSTRRDGELRFDHGAQYFTARDPRFIRHVMAWQERGLVQPWNGRVGAVEDGTLNASGTQTVRWVGIPGMNSVCGDMAQQLSDVRFGWEVVALKRTPSGWTAENTQGEQIDVGQVVLTAPPAQATALVPEPSVKNALKKVSMRPCWAVMTHLESPLFEQWDGVFVNQGPLSWVASQRGRPDRPDANAWVLHANPEWSAAHLDDSPLKVAEALVAAARELPSAAAVSVHSATAHRWRYALAGKPLDVGALRFPELDLVLAGDWAHGSRVEGAFLSGVAAAGHLMALDKV
jgi:predicted NAD/FAD-dependent oxidoreductase